MHAPRRQGSRQQTFPYCIATSLSSSLRRAGRGTTMTDPHATKILLQTTHNAGTCVSGVGCRVEGGMGIPNTGVRCTVCLSYDQERITLSVINYSQDPIVIPDKISARSSLLPSPEFLKVAWCACIHSRQHEQGDVDVVVSPSIPTR